MRGMVPPDPETEVSREQAAIVYLPGRSRNRFPAGNVQVMDSRAAALNGADPAHKRFPAIVVGPSKSSEGQYIFYLVQWLIDPVEDGPF